MPRTERVEDPGDPRLDDYRDLRDARGRSSRGLFVAEGVLMVTRLLGSPRFRTRSVLLTPAMLDRLQPLLDGHRPPPAVHLALEGVIRTVTGFPFHRGCLAVGERGPDLAVASLLGPPGPRRLVLAEDLGDIENVGGLFRNAQAFGVDGVLLAPGTADPLNRKALRASAGGALAVPFARSQAWSEDLAAVRTAGFTLVALTPGGAREIAEVTAPPARLALLVGSEAQGLSAAAWAAADLEVRIAMAPGVDSLNVATACGIALHRLCSRPPDR